MKKEAFGELVISNQESWYRIAKSYLCNDADCADAIQNAIVHAFENLYSLRNDKYAKTWFIRILINECHQVIRRNIRKKAGKRNTYVGTDSIRNCMKASCG